MLVAFAGLPGVGKTTISRIVATRLEAAYLRIDAIEQALFRARGHRPVRLCDRERLTAENLALGRAVVADAA